MLFCVKLKNRDSMSLSLNLKFVPFSNDFILSVIVRTLSSRRTYRHKHFAKVSPRALAQYDHSDKMTDFTACQNVFSMDHVLTCLRIAPSLAPRESRRMPACYCTSGSGVSSNNPHQTLLLQVSATLSQALASHLF